MKLWAAQNACKSGDVACTVHRPIHGCVCHKPLQTCNMYMYSNLKFLHILSWTQTVLFWLIFMCVTHIQFFILATFFLGSNRWTCTVWLSDGLDPRKDVLLKDRNQVLTSRDKILRDLWSILQCIPRYLLPSTIYFLNTEKTLKLHKVVVHGVNRMYTEFCIILLLQSLPHATMHWASKPFNREKAIKTQLYCTWFYQEGHLGILCDQFFKKSVISKSANFMGNALFRGPVFSLRLNTCLVVQWTLRKWRELECLRGIINYFYEASTLLWWLNIMLLQLLVYIHCTTSFHWLLHHITIKSQRLHARTIIIKKYLCSDNHIVGISFLFQFNAWVIAGILV